MNTKKEVVVFDLETTGTWIEKDKIIEIAMIKCFPDGGRDQYCKKVNPGMPIPQEVVELTGISDNDVKDAPPFKEIANEVVEFIGEADFGGFNVDRFDIPLLLRELREAGVSLNMEKRQVFDAQKVFHVKEKRDLTAAYHFYCDKTLDNAHSALVDTEATLEILSAQISRYCGEDQDVECLKAFNYRTTSEFYDADRKFRWWNGKLYMMFGKYAKHYCLQEVVQKDPGYCEWIVSANFSNEVKELVANALKGQYPEPQNQAQKTTS